MLELTRKPIGMGRERMCFVHPEDPRLAVKISTGGSSGQSEREIRLYGQLEKRGATDNKHIPGFHGVCETNRGPGFVVDLVRNYDGEISRPLNWYLGQGYPIEEFEPFLEELKQFFLRQRILFDPQLEIDDILVQKTSASKFRMVVIDSLGDGASFGLLNFLPFLARRKIRRRWQDFMVRVYSSREVLLQREEPESEAGADY